MKQRSFSLNLSSMRQGRCPAGAFGTRQQGFTLIELLVSLALGLGVLVAMASVYVAAKQTFKFQETGGRMQEDANYALEQIARELRMAGFAGCALVDAVDDGAGIGTKKYIPTSGLKSTPTPNAITSSNPLALVATTNVDVTAQPLTPANFLRGFDSVPSALFASGSAPTASNANALFFSGGSANVVSVTAAMVGATSDLTIASDPYGWASAANGYTMIVSDCTQASIFVGKVNSGGTAIDHSTTYDNANNFFPLNAIYSNTAGSGAIVMPLEWRLYYVDTRSGASTSSLYQVRFDGSSRKNAEEVISNVESIRLHYGENTAGFDSTTVPGTTTACTLPTTITVLSKCAPTQQPNVWRTSAATVTSWNNVVAVRVGLMLVSSDSTVANDITANTVTLLGQSYTVPTTATAGRLRKEYSTTVSLRNRISPR